MLPLRDLLRHPIPAPPAPLRRGPLRHQTDQSPPHDARTAALLGRALGVAFGVCFLTGLLSHIHQNPPAWFDVPSRPVWAYQLTQGVHVATGIASVPLLLAKLWTVYRRLFAWPPFPDLARLLERLLLVPLVAGAVFELVTGLLNIVQWYPWRFGFPVAHYRVAWLLIGAMLVHVAIKAPLARSVTGRRRWRPDAPPEAAPSPERRAVLAGVAAAASAVTIATVGQTVEPLRAVSLLAPRDPALGPQGLPVNRTAAAAWVAPKALDPGWRLIVADHLQLSLADLLALPQHEVELPIACVEGWSASAQWGGVRLRDVLDLASVPSDRRLTVVSLEEGGYRTAPVGPAAARDPLTLLAMRVRGEPLHVDHGYPLRLIAPNRPGVQQTKWLSRIEVRS